VLASVLYYFMFTTNSFKFFKRKEERHRKLIFSISSKVKIINRKVWQTLASPIYYFFFYIWYRCKFFQEKKLHFKAKLTSRFFLGERYTRSLRKFFKKRRIKEYLVDFLIHSTDNKSSNLILIILETDIEHFYSFPTNKSVALLSKI